ncbi:DUF4288 domain-containing protein [Corynebacterium sp. SA-MJD20WY100]|uniref:DUF4288 domain-containing protein n=1 Tax=Corynebacterium sp. SA-MJD20WY100 TaxID=3142969 RepID=UPI003221AA03
MGIIVFELESVEPSEPSYFREDSVLVRATDDDEARAKVVALARSQESAEHPAIVMRHIVEVAPALDGTVEEEVDLYARHCASLEDYARFDMKLGGSDPFA